MKSGAVCIAYETITGAGGGLPLLAPMSEVAGRMAVQAGALYLRRPTAGAACCSAACLACSLATWPSSVPVWWAPTPYRWQWAWVRV